MLAIKLKKKRPSNRNRQVSSLVESQWKQLIDHLEASKNVTTTETPSNTSDEPVDVEAIAAKPVNVGRCDLDCTLRILATHCCTATVIGLASFTTGFMSSAIAGAYLTGTFATCGFVGMEMFRLRLQPQA
jgi:hypothetical protein